MPTKVVEYKCLLISPSDVDKERNAITEMVIKWNAQIGQVLGARIELVKYESHSTPEMGGHPQAILNKQIVDHCDLGIAIFWSKLGTPTDQNISGSVEEIETLMSRGARILIYFSKQPVPQENIQNDQYKKLLKYKEDIRNKGFLGEYHSIENLVEQLQLHLTSVIAELLTKDKENISLIPIPDTSKASKPDIRLKITGGIVSTPLGPKDIISVTVQNHSNLSVFLGMVRFKLSNNYQLVIHKDSVTGEPQRRKELRPGEAFNVYIYPEDIFKQVSYDDITTMYITDDIDRIYEADSTVVRSILETYWRKYQKTNMA